MRVAASSLRRHGTAAVLLLFAVLLHMLCSAGHPATAAELAAADAPASAPSTAASSPASLPASTTDPAPALAVLTSPLAAVAANADPNVLVLGAHEAGESHECTNATDGSTDQRGTSPSPLTLLLAVGFIALIVLWAPPAPGRNWRAERERRPRRRNAARLLLALCVWRV